MIDVVERNLGKKFETEDEKADDSNTGMWEREITSNSEILQPMRWMMIKYYGIYLIDEKNLSIIKHEQVNRDVYSRNSQTFICPIA